MIWPRLCIHCDGVLSSARLLLPMGVAGTPLSLVTEAGGMHKDRVVWTPRTSGQLTPPPQLLLPEYKDGILSVAVDQSGASLQIALGSGEFEFTASYSL
jgi:hypothetical protein